MGVKMTAFLYFAFLILIVAIGFTVFRRPMYEVIFGAFVLLTVFTGKITSIFTYMTGAANTYLLYTIAAFICFSIFFEKTDIISDMIHIIIALVGRFSGGAGYVAILASAAMGALSGTGPGNAAAIGVITIPTMKKTGFPSELAATVEMAASSLGPVIPPSGAIVILFGALDAFSPHTYTFSQFWLLAWVVSFWFLLHRFLTLFFLIRKYDVKPIPKEERMPFGQALKKGWKTLLLPIVIFAPFFVDAFYNTSFVADRLGEAGAAASANILLTTIPSIAIAFVAVLYVMKGNRFSFHSLVDCLKDGISGVAPVIIMAYAGFCITELFNDIGVAESISLFVADKQIPLWFAAVICPLIFTVLGMFMEVTSLFVLLGPVYIALAAAAGINPMLAAMMVNPMTCAMGHMTPPFALCFYVCMGIAESDFKETTKLSVIWCVGQYVLTILILYGLVPMFGLLG